MGKKFVLLAIFGLALVMITVLCGLRHRAALEAELGARAEGALAAAGHTGIEASAVNGRDIVLAGMMAGDEVRRDAVVAVGKVDGVRRVIDRVEIRPSTTFGTFGLVSDGDTLILTGVVSDQGSAQRLVALARSRFPNLEVVDDMRIDELANGELMSRSLQLIDVYDPTVIPGGLEWNADGLLLTGEVASEEQRRELGDRLVEVFSGIPVLNRLEVAPQPALNRVLELRNVEFESGSARLTAVGRGALDEIASVLAEWPQVVVEISGHTDSTGNPDFNQHLSRLRAEAARDYLAQTIAAERMTTVGYGSSRPVASNDTPDGRIHNRRIEFRVTGDDER